MKVHWEVPRLKRGILCQAYTPYGTITFSTTDRKKVTCKKCIAELHNTHVGNVDQLNLK